MKSNNTFIIKLSSLLVYASLFYSCRKLPDGFISPQIRYEETPFLINRGRTSTSSGLNFDGSSIPATVTLLHVYDEAGNNVDEMFMKQYTIKGWTQLYNPDTDTTVESIAAKQADMQVAPIVINSSSGQIEANYKTLEIPSGNYSYDLQITNSAGTLVYPKIGQMQFLDPVYADQAEASPYDKLYEVGNENVSAFAATPVVTIERLADEPNIVVMKIVDKNGTPFNPNAGEIIQRPYPGLNPPQPYLQTLQDYSLRPYQTYDDRFEFPYGTLPFPLISKGNGFNLYYRIPTQYFHADDQANIPDDKWSLNPRFGFRAYVQGKYLVTITLPDMTHR